MLLSSVWLINTVAAEEPKGWLDPTRPLGYSAVQKKENDLILQAIFYGSGRKEAIVNGIPVKEGDQVYGKRITRINPQEIVYETANGFRTIKLRPSIFDK